jgi:predicted transcriptional regulator
MVGVEVSGGGAHLKVGTNDGWIASEIITCPPDYRYDLVLLKVDTPGASYVDISVLNASANPDNMAFANKTIEGFEHIRASDISLNSIDHQTYPAIRIQVDLHADGTDKPKLLAWSVLFVDMGEWREEFLGSGKMSRNYGLNFTDDTLEVNLTRSSGDVGYYEPFPPIAVVTTDLSHQIFYPNAMRDGYNNAATLTSQWSWDTTFADLNHDSYLDHISSSDPSTIFWGGVSGTYSNAKTTELSTYGSISVAAGDFNGDGWVDLAFGGSISGKVLCYVFLNNGNGTFDDEIDITLNYPGLGIGVLGKMKAGDVNSDGYDEIFLQVYRGTSIYYGGPNGPNETNNATLDCYVEVVKDIDLDGHLDILSSGFDGLHIYLGGKENYDTIADFTLPPATGWFSYPGAGDVNGDGYVDIVVPQGADPNWYLGIFEGAADGWKSTRFHNLSMLIPGYSRYQVADIDRDGYGDILYIDWDDNLNRYEGRIIYGGLTWPSASEVILSRLRTYEPLAIAIPTGPDGPIRLGVFTTENITLPRGEVWDVLLLEGNTPKNTSMNLSVLNTKGTPIKGYNDISEWKVDLSSIDPDSHRTIRLMVRIASFNQRTPTIENILVKWIDERTWRDEFYWDAKVKTLLGLDVANGHIQGATTGGTGDQLIIPSLRGDLDYDRMSYAYRDAGGLDYTSLSPMAFQTVEVMATSVTDVNGDGHLDVAYASYTTSGSTFATKSPVFLGSPVGWKDLPYRTFNTTGARDVLLQDLNEDGHVDVVFAQEQNGNTYAIDSLLFWGSSTGWSETPDIRFKTKGASGVVAEDLDGDGDLDLAFACYKDTSTNTDSMVFLQGEDGFNGTTPDHLLATRGARAVAAGDLNGDDLTDLVFANSLSGSTGVTGSFVYLAKGEGGYEGTPKGLPADGAQDVKVADLDGDGHLDIVFAILHDDGGDYTVGSPVYLNDGTGSFSGGPTRTLATIGAMAVEVADLDGTGWKDLVFASHFNGSSYSQTSVGYLGGSIGWPSSPDIAIPTVGASDVVAAYLFEPGDCGYMSQSITPRDREGTGSYHTFRYTATMGGSVTGTFHIVDAVTWETLVSTPIAVGTNEWDLRTKIFFRSHPSVRIVAEVNDLDAGGTFQLDDLYLNWTPRVKGPPRVVDLALSATSAYRTEKITLWVNVTDEYNLPDELTLMVEHQQEGHQNWYKDLISTWACIDGVWTTELYLDPKIQAGMYNFRAWVIDSDDMVSDILEPPVTLEILNNLPTAPEISLSPESPLASDTLTVTITQPASDVENSGIAYRILWYRNGGLVQNLNTDYVPPDYTVKGQNWSVEVRAFDGDDNGPPATAWVIIGNSPVEVGAPLMNPILEEDGPTVTFDLAAGFGDPDEEPLKYGVEEPTGHILVEVDEVTGEVTLSAEVDWSGDEEVTFWASDGESTAQQTVIVMVTSVNDVPRFSEVNGGPVPSGVLVLTIDQGETLVITYSVSDVENDPLLMAVDTNQVYLDEARREIRFTAPNDMVGSLSFSLMVWDIISPMDVHSVAFEIVVENVNDPPGMPSIIAPPDGSKFKVNESFTLEGVCDDPDIQFGQVLEFIWSSNISGPLGTGRSLDISLPDPGIHLLTLTVGDGEFERSVTITLIIEPLQVETPGPSEDGFNLMVMTILILVIMGIVLAVGVSTEPGKYRLGLMFAPLVVRRKEVLDNKTRYALHGIIAERPGIHYSAIKEEFGLSNGAAAYHLDVLERERFIRSVRDGRLKRFYSARTKISRDQRMTPEEIRATIIGVVRERPGISQMELIEELGVDRDTVGYHLRMMVKEGLLKTDKQWRYTTYRIK